MYIVMKKIKLICLFVSLSVLNSCSLDILPDSVVSNESYWETESDVQSAVDGIYSKMRGQLDAWKWMYWFEARSGNIAPGFTSSGIGSYINNQITSNLNDTNWANLYNIVSQTNAVITNIDRVTFHNTTLHDELLAEAYAVRAWCYFNLVRLWGDVPLITNFVSSLDDPQLYPERSPKSTVYETIKSDIENAEQLYLSNEIKDRCKISRAAILMLRADIYLWMYKVEEANADYLTKAEKSVDEILALPKTALSLQGSYKNVFDKEGNTEIIFSIYYDKDENSSQYGSLLAQSSTLVPAALRNNPIPVATSANRMNFSKLFYDNCRNRTSGDTRVGYISSDIESGGVNYRYTLKYMGEMNGVTRVFTTDTRIYRLAEAYLFKAEILAEQGNYPKAVEYLNDVVARAYNEKEHYPKTLAGEEFKAALLDERMIEFAGECKSWFDLIRFGEVFNRVPTLAGRENDNQGNILLLPVNDDTISRNPKIKQTPGYEKK